MHCSSTHTYAFCLCWTFLSKYFLSTLNTVTLPCFCVPMIDSLFFPSTSHPLPGAKDLLSKMLHPHPLSRASLEDILSHPWLRPQRHSSGGGGQRRLSRHPAKSHLCERARTKQDTSPQVVQTQLEKDTYRHLEMCSDCVHCRQCRDTKCSTKSSHHKTVARKNSSGYLSGSSDLNSLPSPSAYTTSQ